MLNVSSVIETVVEFLGLLVATIASVANNITMKITKNEIRPDVSNIRSNLDSSIERA